MKTSLVSNGSALVNQRSLKRVKFKLDKSSQKLSTGKRINTAADDAAGLSIASSLTARVKSSSRALRNANDAISFVQVAEGALVGIHELLTRLRELSIKNGSDNITDPQRAMVNQEYRELKSEIDRITYSTKLLNKRLLDGSLGNMKVQVGLHSGGKNEITIDARRFSNTIHALGIFDIDASTKLKAIKSLRKIDYAISEVANSRAYFGSMMKVLLSASASLDNQIAHKTQANSKIMDADYAKQSAEHARNKVIQNAGVSVQAQANEKTQTAARIVIKATS